MRKILLIASLFLCMAPFFRAQNAYVEMSRLNGLGQVTSLDFEYYNDFGKQVIENDKVYIVGVADHSNGSYFNTTNGTSFTIADAHIFLLITDTLGNQLYSTVHSLGPKNITNVDNLSINVENGNVYISGNTNSSTLITTNGSYANGDDLFLIYFSATTIQNNGSIYDYASYFGGNSTDILHDTHVENGNYYGALITYSNDLITTNASFNAGTSDVYLFKVSNTSIQNNTSFAGDPNNYATYIGGTEEEEQLELEVNNGNIYLVFQTQSEDLNLSNPSLISNLLYSKSAFYRISNSSINADLPINSGVGDYSTLISYTTDGSTSVNDLIYESGKIYCTGLISGNNLGVTAGDNFSYAGLSYLYVLSDVTMNAQSYIPDYFSLILNGTNSFESVFICSYLGDIYIMGRSYNNIATTDGSVNNGATGKFLSKINQSTITNNTAVYNDPLSKIIIIGGFSVGEVFKFEVNDKGLHLLITNAPPPIPITNSTNGQPAYLNYCHDLKFNYSTKFGHTSFTNNSMMLYKSSVYFTGLGFSSSTIQTLPIVPGGIFGSCLFFTKVTFVDPNPVLNDSIFPNTQTVCQFGVAQLLTGEFNDSLLVVPPDIFTPPAGTLSQFIYTNQFKWQSSASPAGPWTDEPAGTLENFLPPVGSVDRYYRRVIYYSACGDTTILHTSNVVSVLVNNLLAPIVDAGGVYHSCPNTVLNLGGVPSATGGTPPYTYLWDNSLGSTANVTYPAATNSLITLTVTDANGCFQYDQAIVNVYQANAGANKNICNGSPVQLGTPPIQGVIGTVYSWSPAAGLSCTNCAQPICTATTTTNYTFTLTIPLNGGGTCQTTDDVLITATSATPLSNFAGNDVTFCFGNTTQIGVPAVAGYSYNWYPGNYLSNPSGSIATVNVGNLSYPPNPNPLSYTCKASMNGCDFFDEVKVYAIRANAGIDGCGPRMIGSADVTPNLNETYTWTLLSGPGNFTGPTNTPTTTVSASIGGTSVYQLAVSLNGVTCYDVVVVPNCGCSMFAITNNATAGCPSYEFTNDSIDLTAGPLGNNNLVYSWSPAIGISSSSSQVVTLQTNSPQTYTVTITDPQDPNFFCTQTILVNQPSWSIPSVPTMDTTICLEESVEIGFTAIPNYNYSWTYNGDEISTDSNPLVFPTNLTNHYILTLEDQNSGCRYRDTSTVLVDHVFVSNGGDWVVCDNAIIQLGGYPNPNATYSWSPAIAPWQNGTDNTSPQPEVLVSVSTTFIATVQGNGSNCFNYDTIDVYVNNLPVIDPLPNYFVCKDETKRIGNPAINGLSYSWSPSTGLSCTNCAQPYVTLSSSIVYTLTITAIGNCTNALIEQVNVTVIENPLNLNDITFCPSSGPYSMGNLPPYIYNNYYWEPMYGLTSSFGPNPSGLIMDTTTYYLTIIDNNGCSFTDSLIATPIMVSPNAGLNKQMCLNDFSVSIGDPSNLGSVIWTPSTFLSSATSSVTTFTPPSTGVYNFTLSQTIAGCTSTDNVQVIVNDFNLPPIPNQFICANTCTSIGITPQPGVSYNWSPSLELNNGLIANPLACPSQSTTFTLSAVNVFGCSATQEVSITLSDSLSPDVTVNDIFHCLGDSNLVFPNLIVSPPSNNYTYSPAFGLSNPFIQNPSILSLNMGNTQYNLTVVNNLTGCSATTDFVFNLDTCPQITQCEIPFQIISIQDTICSGDIMVLNFLSDSTNVSYNWTAVGNNVVGFSSGSGTQLNSTLTTITSSLGEVTYTVTPTLNQCFGEPQIYTVTVIPSPIVSIIGNLNYCQGDSTLLASSIQGSSYLWNNVTTDSTGYFNNFNNPITLSVTNEFGCEGISSPIQLIENSTYLILDTLSICATDSILLFGNYENIAGDYRDTLSSVLGCDSIIQIHLLVSQQPNLFIALNNDTLCSGESVILNFSSDSLNASFSWIQNSNNVAGASDGIGNSVTQMLSTTNPLGGMVDYVITADLFGCEADADTVSIFVAPIPMVEIIGSLYYCEGDSALLTANASYNQYVWSDGSTDSTIYATSANNPISLTATNNYNCSALSNGIILQEQLVANFSDSLFICQGDSALIFGQYQTIGATFTDTLISNGCDSIVTIHLIVNPLPIIQLTSSDDTICQGNTVNFIASGGVNYEWNVSAVTTNEIDIIPPQSQEVIVSGFNTFGCSNTDTISIVVIENDSAYFYYDNNTFCLAGNNPVLNSNNSFGGLYSSTPIGISLDVNTGAIDLINSLAGTYQITYQTTGYCPTSFDTSIILVDVPDASFSYSNSSFCLDPNGNDPTIISGQISQLSVTPIGLVYNVNTGAIDLSLSQPGVYTLTNLVSIIGCPTANFDTVLTLFDLPTAIVDSVYFVCDVSVLPEIEVNLTGIGPWEFNYVDPNGNNVTVQTNQTPYFISNITLGDYIITTLSDQNCYNQINKIIKVILYEGPILNPINNLTACNGELISNINFSANVTAATYAWQTIINDVGQGQSGQGSINSFTAINLTGNNIVSTIEVLASDNVCPGTSESFTITVFPSPNPIINSTQLEGCAPLSVELSSNFTSGCVWTVNSVTHQDCNPQFTLFNPGCYDVQLSVTDANQCVATTNTPSLICVFENPISNFTPSTESANLLNAGIDFDNTSINGNSYIWSIDGVEVSTNENLYYLFSTTDTASYQVCLIAESNNNCLDTFCRIIEIGNSFNLYIPNAFTPHSDNINDVFVPIISGEYSEYEFRIFDRWGLEIFQTNVVNEGWDGTYLSNYVQQDVYVWKINIKDKANNKWYNLIGHVTLIR